MLLFNVIIILLITPFVGLPTEERICYLQITMNLKKRVSGTSFHSAAFSLYSNQNKRPYCVVCAAYMRTLRLLPLASPVPRPPINLFMSSAFIIQQLPVYPFRRLALHCFALALAAKQNPNHNAIYYVLRPRMPSCRRWPPDHRLCHLSRKQPSERQRLAVVTFNYARISKYRRQRTHPPPTFHPP